MGKIQPTGELGMSKIQKELIKATRIDVGAHAVRNDFLREMVVNVGALPDDEWEGLSTEAQDWFNGAADTENANAAAVKTNRAAKPKDIPDFPDAVAEQEPEAKTTRRRGSATQEVKSAVAVGSNVKVVTKRGKEYLGRVVELDADVMVLEVDGAEVELDRARLETTEVFHGDAKPGKQDQPADEPAGDPLKVGTAVVLETKRGAEVAGKIVEVDDEVIVLDVAGDEKEYRRDRVESVKVASSSGTPQVSSRRGAPAPAEKEPDPKSKRVVNEGVSIGQRIKELIADDLSATEEDIGKKLKAEKMEFKENTLSLNFKDAHKFVEILRKKKMLK